MTLCPSAARKPVSDHARPVRSSKLLVDWGGRLPDWGERLAEWCAGAPDAVRPRVLLFGPHSDLAAHAEARASGLGPMMARSKLVADLATLFA